MRKSLDDLIFEQQKSEPSQEEKEGLDALIFDEPSKKKAVSQPPLGGSPQPLQEAQDVSATSASAAHSTSGKTPFDPTNLQPSGSPVFLEGGTKNEWGVEAKKAENKKLEEKKQASAVYKTVENKAYEKQFGEGMVAGEENKPIKVDAKELYFEDLKLKNPQLEKEIQESRKEIVKADKEVPLAFGETEPSKEQVAQNIQLSARKQAKEAEYEIKGLDLKEKALAYEYEQEKANFTPEFFAQLETDAKEVRSLEQNIQDGKWVGDEQSLQRYNELAPKVSQAVNSPELKKLINTENKLDEINADRATLLERYPDFKLYSEIAEQKSKEVDDVWREKGIVRKAGNRIFTDVGNSIDGLIKGIATLPRTLTPNDEIGWTDKLADFSESIVDLKEQIKSPQPTSLQHSGMEDVENIDGYKVFYDKGKPVSVRDENNLIVRDEDLKNQILSKTTGKTEKDFSVGSLANSAFQVISDMSIQLLPVAGATGRVSSILGAGQKSAAGIGLLTGVTTQVHNDAYVAAKQAGATNKEASSYALANSAMITAISAINPLESKLATRMFKGRSPVSASEYVKTLAGGKAKATAKDRGISAVKNTLKETWLEEVPELYGEDGLKRITNSVAQTDFETGVSAKEVANTVLITTLATPVMGAMDVNSGNPLMKDALLQAVKNPNDLIVAVDEMVGKKVATAQGIVVMTPEMATKLKEDINVISQRTNSIVQSAQLNDEKTSIAAELVKRKLAIEAMNKAENVDDVVVSKNKEQISAINKQLEMLVGWKEGDSYIEIDGNVMDEAEFKKQIKDEQFLERFEQGSHDITIQNNPKLVEEFNANLEALKERQEPIKAEPIEEGRGTEVAPSGVLQAQEEKVEPFYEKGAPEAKVVELEPTITPKAEEVAGETAVAQQPETETRETETPAQNLEESNIPTWHTEFERAKKENDLPAIDTLYNKVKVALNGLAQSKGEATVKEFETLKKDIEKYAEEWKKQTKTNEKTKKEDSPQIEGNINNTNQNKAEGAVRATEKPVRVKDDTKDFSEGRKFALDYVLNDLVDVKPLRPKMTAEEAKYMKGKKGRIEDGKKVKNIRKAAKDISQRVDWKMKNEERHRAIRDIKKGKYNTISAKMLLDRLEQFHDNGYFDFIAGTGSMTVQAGEIPIAQIKQHLAEVKALKEEVYAEYTPEEVAYFAEQDAIINEIIEAIEQDELNDDEKFDTNLKQIQDENTGTEESPIEESVGQDVGEQEEAAPEKVLTEKEKAAKELADRIRKKKWGGANVVFDFGLTKTIYNFAVDKVADAVESGTELGKAIQQAVEWIESQMNGKEWDKKGFSDSFSDDGKDEKSEPRFSETEIDGKHYIDIVENGKIIGTIRLKEVRDQIEVSSVDVREENKKQGNATKLYEEAVKYAKSKGYKGIVSGANEITDPAIKKIQDKFVSEPLDKGVLLTGKKDGKVPPTEKGEKSERQKRKKILGTRAYEGEISEEEKAYLEEKGLFRGTYSQEERSQQAQEYIDKFGEEAALRAVDTLEIRGAVATSILAKLLVSADVKIAQLENTDTEQLDALQKEKADITAIMEREGYLSGEMVGQLAFEYENSDLKFNVEKQIEEYKAANNGEISPETEAKFRELGREITQLKAQIAEAEEKAKRAEEQAAIQAIQEKNQRGKKNKVSEQKASEKIKKAKQDILAKLNKAKIHRPDIFMAATPASLAWDGAVEVVKQTVDLTGDIAVAVARGVENIRETDWYKNLTQEKRSEAEAAFRGFFMEEETVEGRLKIPTSLIRDLVARGHNTIESLTQAVKDAISEQYPDATDREIRDAITGYGKVANLNQEEIATQIRKITRLGRLISQMEDIQARKRPMRSGIQRDKLDAEERAKMKEVREAMKDLPVSEADLEQQMKTALDAAKTRLQNQIEDLQREIDKGERVPKNARTIKDDSELTELKEKRDKVKAEHDAIFNNEEVKQAKRLELAKKAAERRIADLQRRIREQDFTKKKPTPLLLDTELIRLRAEKMRLQEEYEKEIYKAKIANRNNWEIAKETFWDLVGLGRLFNATLDASFVGVQGGIMASNLAVRNPKMLAEAFANMFRFALSEKKTEDFLRKLKAQDDYYKIKGAKLAITEPHAEITAREEHHFSDIGNMLWNLIGSPLKYKSEAAFNKWAELSPFKIFERAAIGFLDTVRVSKYMDAMQMLERQGKTFENDPQAFKNAADVVNTFTGRASLGFLEQQSKWLSRVFYSPRNWASVFKQTILFPRQITKWRDKETPFKPSVAQKMAVLDLSVNIATTLSMVTLAALYYGNDDDDETGVETDPRSSDFGKIKIGNTRVDPWGGKAQQVVLVSRIITEGLHRMYPSIVKGSYKTSDGDIVPLGTPYKAPTWKGLAGTMVSNKLNPATGLLLDYADTRREEDGELMTAFGQPYIFKDELKETYTPMITQTAKELLKDDPNALNGFLLATAYFGNSVNIYGKKTKKDILEKHEKAKENAKGDTKIKYEIVDKFLKENKAFIDGLEDEDFKDVMKNVKKEASAYANLSTDIRKITKEPDFKDYVEKVKGRPSYSTLTEEEKTIKKLSGADAVEYLFGKYKNEDLSKYPNNVSLDMTKYINNNVITAEERKEVISLIQKYQNNQK